MCSSSKATQPPKYILPFYILLLHFPDPSLPSYLIFLSYLPLQGHDMVEAWLNSLTSVVNKYKPKIVCIHCRHLRNFEGFSIKNPFIQVNHVRSADEKCLIFSSRCCYWVILSPQIEKFVSTLFMIYMKNDEDHRRELCKKC